MKDFLYLDTDYLDSYLSQMDNGLINRTETSVTDQNETVSTETDATSEIKTSGTIKGNVGIPALLGANAEGKTEGTWKSPGAVSSFSETEIGQRIITKTVHDDAFNTFLNHVESDCDYNLLKLELNHYFFSEIEFRILDLDYYINLFSNKDIEKLIPEIDVPDEMKKELLELDGEYNNLDRDAKRAKRKEYDSKKTAIKKQPHQKPSEIFKACKSIFPYSIFLYSKEFIIPVKEKYLREKPNELFFRYDNSVKVLGKTTKILTKLEEHPDPFLNLNKTIANLAIDLVQMCIPDIADELYVVSPIAIFSE